MWQVIEMKWQVNQIFNEMLKASLWIQKNQQIGLFDCAKYSINITTLVSHYKNLFAWKTISDVKRGQNLETKAETRATRPRLRPGQFLEVETKAEAKK